MVTLSSSKPPRVSLVMPLAEQRGGAELMLMHLLRENKCQNNIEYRLTFLEEGPLLSDVRELGYPAHALKAGKLRNVHNYIHIIHTMWQILRQEQPSMVMSWMGKAHLYAGPAAALAGIPAVWWQHGIPDRHWMDRLVTRYPARAILCCSLAAQRAQQKLLPRRPTYVVYPSVDLSRFNPARLPAVIDARRHLGLLPEGPLIGIVGRLQRWKGMHTLVEAMPKILEAYPTANCVVVGGEHKQEAEYPGYLMERIASLGLKDRIRMAGLQNNVPEWMQAMDILVHASDNEPFGMVIIEALALGKLVVAGNKGGPTEIITDGVNGLLTPYGDADALARAVLRYLQEEKFAESIRDAARKRALEFSTGQCARNINSTICEILSEYRGSKQSIRQ